ncbi:MAG: non-homologous end-joining DNA ligase, partial [Limisphaerales bacterium]
GQNKEQWLFFKSGEDAAPLSSKKDDESVLTKRSMKQVARDNDAQWESHHSVENKKSVSAKSSPKIAAQKKSPKINRASLKNFPSGQLEFVGPMKCRLLETPPQGDEWIYEIKFDGFRAIAVKQGRNVQLFSRAAKDFSARFPEALAAIQKLPCKNAVFDGEIVALDPTGRSSFQLLQMSNMPGEKRPPICFYLFDLLNLEGKDLKNSPLRDRKKILQSLLSPQAEPARFSADLKGDPEQLLAEIRKHGLEGIIAKRLDSKYETGRRSGAWSKIKVINEQEFVIGGYTPPKGSRDYFGALLVGFFEKEKLIFASKVGTGFNHALLKSLYQQFQKIKRDDCPFVNLPEKRRGRWGQGITAREMKNCFWLNPKLVCQISFTEWTRDDHLRHPVFLGLREDKKAREVVREISA